ncbi:MAG: GIY-YIG nuclease family protein [Candidatus Omnitrophica bacterium]|nr:GIY-YIG nuclease family protein [Candidatus Omnitrophota bacterium]
MYKQPWFVYIAQCRDNTLYVGITKDIEKRIESHNTAHKCRYTRGRKPLKLVYKELCKSYSFARKREQEVKRFSRDKKLALIGRSL